MFPFNYLTRGPLFEVEGSQTSIGADVAELEGEVETPEESEVIEEVETPEGEGEGEVVVEGEEEDEEIPEETLEEESTPTETFHPFERPTIKQLNEAFPQLFKKFPSLKDMYFREAEFTKVFPTIEDAKEASENNSAFNNIREDIFSGDGSKFLSSVKEVDEKGLDRFARNFLPNLVKVHPQAFWQAANPLVEDILRNVYNKGVKDNDENLQNAARHVAKFFFGDEGIDITEGKKTTVIKEEKSEVSEERKVWDNEKHQVFRTGVNTDLRGQLRDSVIGKDQRTGKSKIDPDEVFSDFITTTIIDKVITDLGDQLEADKTHLRYMDSLWDQAKKHGRTDADKSRIISAYLARAKAIIPSLRSKYVSEALGKRVRDASRKKEVLSSQRTESRSSGRPSGHRTSGKIDYSKTSDLDILNDNVTYKN